MNCHAREVDDLEDPFALVVSGDTFVLAVRRGLLEPGELDLLDRLIVRGSTHFAVACQPAALTA